MKLTDLLSDEARADPTARALEVTGITPDSRAVR